MCFFFIIESLALAKLERLEEQLRVAEINLSILKKENRRLIVEAETNEAIAENQRLKNQFKTPPPNTASIWEKFLYVIGMQNSVTFYILLHFCYSIQYSDSHFFDMKSPLLQL